MLGGKLVLMAALCQVQVGGPELRPRGARRPAGIGSLRESGSGRPVAGTNRPPRPRRLAKRSRLARPRGPYPGRAYLLKRSKARF